MRKRTDLCTLKLQLHRLDVTEHAPAIASCARRGRLFAQAQALADESVTVHDLGSTSVSSGGLAPADHVRGFSPEDVKELLHGLEHFVPC